MSLDEITFPVAETFYSIQGEAEFAGTPMFFIRLAGCNVGKYNKLSDGTLLPNTDSPFQIANPQYATCTSMTGKSFVCDTDYRIKERLSIQQLIAAAKTYGARFVSITGGEPLIHKHLPELVQALEDAFLVVNVETSGTIDLSKLSPNAYITCSPKAEFLYENLDYISQFKILVEGPKDVEWALNLAEYTDCPQIWLQAIEHYDANGPVKTSYDYVVEQVLKYPEKFKLSVQMHKVIGVR